MIELENSSFDYCKTKMLPVKLYCFEDRKGARDFLAGRRNVETECYEEGNEERTCRVLSFVCTLVRMGVRVIKGKGR